MNTQLPLRGANTFRNPRKVTNLLPRCSCLNRPVARQWQAQCQIRQYSTPPPPPKTYFQPGDSHAPDPRYFKPAPITPTLPPGPSPATYFQPGDSYSPNNAYPPDAKPKRRFSFRNFVYASIFASLGLIIGAIVDREVNPRPSPERGSRQDLIRKKFIHRFAERLPIVKSLSEDPEWIAQDPFENIPDEAKKSRLTQGPLGTASALGGYRRAFYHKSSGEAITVVFFGKDLDGFPKTTHGGLIATVLDEVLGICAIKQLPAKTGVTANLELNYLAPVQSGKFYIIRAVPVAQGMTERKCFATGTVEDTRGRILVEAKGLFVVPKQYTLKAIST